MANEEHLALLKQGVDAWNAWRRENPGLDPDLRGAVLTRAFLNGADLSRAKLGGAGLRGADLTRAKLSGADLRGAVLRKAVLSQAELSEADLTRTVLTRAVLNGAVLGGAVLFKAVLTKADLAGAVLTRAILYRADLSTADLRGADLTRADLRRTDLRGTDLGGANLASADLYGAILYGADLTRAILYGADLSEAGLNETMFVDVNLEGTKGLNVCDHRGPSTIDHRTLQRSWPLPPEFLRGVGLPDNLIDYLPSLLNQAIQFYSCFISYSSKDDDFAHRLHADLQARGVRCWFAPEDMKIGDRIRDTIDRAIQLRDKLLVVLSEHSIGSPWIEEEVETALEEERHGPDRRAVLFPVRIDDAVLRTELAWARKLRRERHIGDFTRWKDHDTYQKGFERLLRDLKPELERRPGQGA